MNENIMCLHLFEIKMVYIYMFRMGLYIYQKISESSLRTLSDIIYSVIALLAISKTRAYFSMNVYYKKSNVPDIELFAFLPPIIYIIIFIIIVVAV